MRYLSLLFFTSCSFQPANPFVATIEGSIQGKPLLIHELTTQAGAIGSITWDGVEFIDRSQHGASLQSASSYDGLGERLNPTEAGSSWDGPADSPSTSLLVYSASNLTSMSTTVNAALWLQNHQLSGDLISKQVTIGYQGHPDVIEYNTQFTVMSDHTTATFEALTGYLPTNFNQFWFQRIGTLVLTPVPPGGATQTTQYATITADLSGLHAIGMLALTPGGVMGNFGSQFFAASTANTKWNVAYYATPAPHGVYSFKMLVIIGTLTSVKQTIGQL